MQTEKKRCGKIIAVTFLKKKSYIKSLQKNQRTQFGKEIKKVYRFQVQQKKIRQWYLDITQHVLKEEDLQNFTSKLEQSTQRCVNQAWLIFSLCENCLENCSPFPTASLPTLPSCRYLKQKRKKTHLGGAFKELRLYLSN